MFLLLLLSLITCVLFLGHGVDAAACTGGAFITEYYNRTDLVARLIAIARTPTNPTPSILCTTVSEMQVAYNTLAISPIKAYGSDVETGLFNQCFQQNQLCTNQFTDKCNCVDTYDKLFAVAVMVQMADQHPGWKTGLSL